jgi:hypothetical protein
MSSTNPKGIPLLEVGRDVHGRFRKANPGGPGNPFAHKVAALRKALLDSVSEQDLKDVAETLKNKARQGDVAAIKLLLQYCVGKPATPHDLDRMDADEWRRLQEMRVAPRQIDRTIESVPACIACHIAQAGWPCEAQDGPLAETVQFIHAQLQAGAQDATASGKPGTNAAGPDAAPTQPRAAAADQAAEPNAPAEPTAPPAERPSAAQGEGKAAERREPAGRSRRDSHSPTQPPSPNGGNGEEPAEQRRPGQPPRPSGQTERTSPRLRCDDPRQ